MLWEFPHIDPVALELGPIVIRWYALAYLSGFLGGWYLAGKMALRSPDMRPTNDDVDDLLTWIIFGVILGGRLGYVLFYNASFYAANPMEILKVWQGGMSFHGGLLGAALAMVIFARRRKISMLHVTDIVAAVAPLGLFFGRIANFINGELYGRITDSPIGMIFPEGGELPRHPSQLYQAALEGIVLLIITMVMVKQGALKNKPGLVTAVFLGGYGVFRFVVEYFREPDSHLGLIFDVLSMGQLLSLPMIILGFCVYRYRHVLNRI